MEWSAPGYTEIKQLGTGASGRVALAVHDETGVKVAIKYLSEALIRDPAALARFRNEARVLTTLRDPNIATMWEYIQEPNGACIVMELVNGVSLRALLRENGTTEPEAALVVLKGSLLGLARAHKAGVVHKDYKPENVLVRDDGVSKLVDFGVSVPQGTATHPEGTPPYMAPELWEGLPASPATDVYAATAVFFECLTGHRPYRSTEPSVLGYQHVHAPVPFHDAPEPVHELVRRGLAKDPRDRPPSALAFVDELEAAALAAYGEDWEERGRRRLAALVALLALLLPAPPPPTPEVTTSLARTVFHGLRSHAVRVSMGTAVVALVAVAVVIMLAGRREPAEQRVGAAAAVPPTSVTTEPAAAPPSTPPDTPEPTPSPEEEPTASPEAVLPPATPTPPEPVAQTTSPPTPTPTSKPTTKPTPTKKPTKKPTKTPAPTPTPTPPQTPTDTPTTPAPVTSVLGVSVGDVTISGDDVVRATVTLRASGTAAVTATGTWTAPGTAGHVQRLRLSGSTSYQRTFTWALGERPCGRTVTLTVTTSPAAPGGARSGSVAVPACPVRVTGLDVSLSMPAAPGLTARAQVRVTASGTGEIPVEAAFAVNGDQVSARTASLSGSTSYSRAFTHAFRSRPCGATLSVRVRAGDRTETARAEVTCPAGVRQVSIVRAALGEGGLVATVSVGTANVQPVTLDVAFLLGGEPAGSERITLSGDTSYTRTVSQAVKAVPCGTTWTVRASTTPEAGNGSDTASGKTPECPRETPKPEETPKPQETTKTDTPGTIQ